MRASEEQRARPRGVYDETGDAGQGGQAKECGSTKGEWKTTAEFHAGEAAIRTVLRRALPAARRMDWWCIDARELGKAGKTGKMYIL